MEQSLGARLRAQRELQGISLDAISKETKIKAGLLAALERDDVTYWPVGLFRRAYLRSYALMIGADPEPIVREFLERYPDPTELPQDEAPEPKGFRRAMALLGSRRRVFGSDAPRATAGPSTASAPAASDLRADDTLFSGPADVLLPEPEVVEPSTPATGDATVADEPPAPSDRSEPHYRIQSVPAVELPAVEAPGAAAPGAQVSAPGIERPGATASELAAVAELCTRIARVTDWDEMSTLLEDATALLRAVGATIWSWDGRLGALHATWAHGYSADVLARMPRVRRDADNAIADAWRDERTCIVAAETAATGAIVVPMMSSCGCIGVLAVELADRREQDEAVRCLATILAAQLASVLGAPPLVEAASA